MRPKIFNFPQVTLLRLGLNLKEILFLDYFQQIAGSGHMRSKRVDEKVVLQNHLQKDNGGSANTKH